MSSSQRALEVRRATGAAVSGRGVVFGFTAGSPFAASRTPGAGAGTASGVRSAGRASPLDCAAGGTAERRRRHLRDRG
ncbi:MAG TPA: hypothetical protein PKJ66_14090, partial [Rhodocyclaceae bacterium]|nr:hypothetical protein [Rhodocyclaceae bacterium]